MPSTLQNFVHELPRMQQAVLLNALRGADGVAKHHPSKYLQRYLRRCILVAAFEGRPILDMHEPGGGDYTGPVPHGVDPVKEFFSVVDELPHHYVTHFMDAAQVLGYNGNDFWLDVYRTWCTKLHVVPEALERFRNRLGDNENDWRALS